MATYIGSDGYVRTKPWAVPGQPHIITNGTSYWVSRTVGGKSQYQGGIKSLAEAIRVRDAFVKALPAETTAEVNIRTKKGKGTKVNPKELQKASRWFYKRGEVSSPNYLDLKGAQIKKVYDNVATGATPGTFSKNTIYTPLKTSQQNKILKAFPEADFDLWKKGFDATTDSQRFAAVDDFIKRGYKPAFHNVKQLPKKTQDFLIEAFGKEAKAAGTPLEFGPGRKLGITVRENTQLATRINNFLNNVGKTYPYAFSFDRPANWMIAQMHRASKHNNDYKVFKNDAGKIIGASEKGVKYYHVNSGKGKLITSHPEAAQIAKFVDLAKKSRANIPQSLLKIFPKGFDQKLLNSNRAYTDLLRWLDNTQGRRVVANAINIHHAGEGAVVGSPALARDLQLLVASDNLAAASIKKAIETKDFSRVPELKEKGIRLNVGGKEYGAGAETVEAGLKRIEKGALPKLQAQLKIDPKLSSLKNFLQQDVIGFATTNAGGVCGIKSIVSTKAGGGRIGFAAGSSCAREMEIAINKNPLKVTQEIAELPGNKTINTVKNTARGFLGTLGKLGTKAAPLAGLAVAGAAIEPLVKKFMIDDPTTYLTDESQMKGMLLATIEGETPKVDDEILKWQMPVTAAGAASAIPGSEALYKARRLPTLKRAAMGAPRAALGPLGKAFAGTFSPLAAAITTPLHIAAQRKGGTEWGDIATDPMNWMGPAFAGTGARMATRGMNPSGILSKALRLGYSPRVLRAFSSKLGMPGLLVTGGMWGYDKWKNRSINDED